MAVSPDRLRQRGVALITALLVVVVATVAATAMASRQQLDIRRTGNVLNADQAWAYAEGVEDWAQAILRRDIKDNQVDHLQEAWAIELAPIAVEGGQILGRLEDLQGRFNLNNLINGEAVSAADVALFRRLLSNLELDPELTNALLDWLDADQEVRYPNGAEDSDYLLLTPAYRPANRAMASPSELAAVKGFDAKVMARLAPWISVLPERTAINVNTAGVELLRALHDELSKSEAEALIASRGESGYEKLDDFLVQPALAGRELQASLVVASNYFLLDAQVDIGLAHSQLYSLLHRKDAVITTLSRSRGAW